MLPYLAAFVLGAAACAAQSIFQVLTATGGFFL